MNIPTIDLKTEQLTSVVSDILATQNVTGHHVVTIEAFMRSLLKWTDVEITALELMTVYYGYVSTGLEMVDILIDECMITRDYASTMYTLYERTVIDNIYKTLDRYQNFMPICIIGYTMYICSLEDSI